MWLPVLQLYTPDTWKLHLFSAIVPYHLTFLVYTKTTIQRSVDVQR